MSLIVEDGSIVAGAEAYISVANATTYFTNRGKATAWAAVGNTAAQEAALRLAADFMGQRYRHRWTGLRSLTTQALDWPRQLVPMPDLVSPWSIPAYYPNNAVPVEVSRANAELAIRTVNGELLPDVDTHLGTQVIGSITLTQDPDEPPTTQFLAIDALLRPWINEVTGSVPLGRA
jgi:hypothetical protein